MTFAAGQAIAQLTVADARSLVGALHALKTSASSSSSSSKPVTSAAGPTQPSSGGTRVACSVTLSSEGAHLQWDDETKSLQSQVMLRREAFSDIYIHHSVADRKVTFGVGLSHLADTLSLFSSESSISEGMTISYNPGDERQLQIETRSPLGSAEPASDAAGEAGRVEVNAYAKIGVHADPPNYVDWTDSWQMPETSFCVRSVLLREAVEDLEWPGGSVTLSVDRNPPRVEFLSSGAGSLSVKLPESELVGLSCGQDHLRHAYSFKRLRRTLVAQEQDLEALTKVSISADGALRIMHMLSASQGPRAQNRHHGATFYGNDNYFSSQHAPGRTGIVQYVLLPLSASGTTAGF